MRGFNFVGPVSSLRFEGETIRFTDPATGQEAFLVLRENFYPWSSNNYTLDYPIDPDASHFDLLGVPQPAGIIVSFGSIFNEGERRIFVQHSGVITETHPLDLPGQPAGFWYPVSPDAP